MSRLGFPTCNWIRVQPRLKLAEQIVHEGAGLDRFAFAIAAVAQTAAPQKPAGVGQFPAVAARFFVGRPSVQAEVGHSYSAEQVIERVPTLADDTHITQTRPTLTRFAHADARRTAIPTITRMITATAPAIPTRPAVLPAAWPLSRRQHSPTSRGVARIFGNTNHTGVLAEGTRTTTTFPVDFVGNDRPITRVSETWISPDLKMAVLSKTSDPRSSESVTKLINIVLAEPDPSLFQLPAEHSIVDESAPGIR